ncbi:citrate transporter [Helicobacter monodelphidis]|uniref:SLC13 family permease n=1 Tax=Helicobacter sp. 15-1451 TaxID=2004995 RepID=UPI000DCBD948|nr:SLC13 family permease [Helicobacter sp. 15-1451]RAX56666.1 citrate transporter [Helicobacter sp. 15-1451]
MSEFLAIIGFASLILMVVVLLMDKASPQVTFIIISSIVGFGLVGLESLSVFGIHLGIGQVLGIKSGVFGLVELKGVIAAGVASVAETTALFIFSILFFTILGNVGVFERIINALIMRSGSNIYAIVILSVFVAVIAHLDGSGASTFLIAIPALLPIYQRLGMRPTTLMLILTAAMGIMNLLPWGGPTLRVATITQTDAMDLWFQIMPMQAVGLVLALILALYMGFVEKRRGAGMQVKSGDILDVEVRVYPKFWINIIIALFVLVLLLLSGLPIYFPFMVGSAVALCVNYTELKKQDKVVKEASSAAMMMATTLLAAGVLIGVFDKSGIMKLMAQLILELMPESLGAYLALIIGILAVPMALIFCTDSYFYGILPIVASVGQAFGIDAITLGIVMVVCRNCATFISPVVPATLLGCGLSGVSIRLHIKTSFLWVWAISIICLVSGILLGVIKI